MKRKEYKKNYSVETTEYYLKGGKYNEYDNKLLILLKERNIKNKVGLITVLQVTMSTCVAYTVWIHPTRGAKLIITVSAWKHGVPNWTIHGLYFLRMRYEVFHIPIDFTILKLYSQANYKIIHQHFSFFSSLHFSLFVESGIY